MAQQDLTSHLTSPQSTHHINMTLPQAQQLQANNTVATKKGKHGSAEAGPAAAHSVHSLPTRMGSRTVGQGQCSPVQTTNCQQTAVAQ
jgi:hypothetical protein